MAEITIPTYDQNGNLLDLREVTVPDTPAPAPTPVAPIDAVVQALSSVDPATLISVDDIPEDIRTALGYSGATVFNAGDIRCIASLALTLYGLLIANGTIFPPTSPNA